ncbi:MAG: LacI family DNA-binding transcriptional regulator [Actinobacteria bacterium]|nr:LacI family DNA-binding transcriptional regulator [Actinomycetota bacterium]
MTAATEGRKPNIRQVALLAGVSHMTVSRVLNEHPSIASATRERVLEVMRELNYRPNSAARALATRRTNRLGVVVDSINEFGPASTVRAIEHAAHDRGFTVSSIAVSADRSITAHDALMSLVGIGIDGLCLITPRTSSIDLLREVSRGIPTLVVKSEPEDDFFTVSVDQRRGAALAAQHLIQLGHREIVHLSGPLDWLDAREREQAWHEHLATAGLPARATVVGDWTSDSGFAFGRSVDVDFTAVFAANDQMALGLIHALHERGIRVPEDVSVIGFDDVPDAHHFLPPLTTVRQDFRALGSVSVTTLLAELEGVEVPRRTLLQPELVVRASTASPRAR